MKRFLFIALACAFLAVVIDARHGGAQQNQGAQNASPRAFTFNLRGIDGKDYDLAKMRGQVVLVSFGATWCAPCATELAALEELKREYAGRPVRFLWVSIETEEEASNAHLRSYAKSKNLTLPVLRDTTRAAYGQFTERVRLPFVVLFDAEGNFSQPALVGMAATPDIYKERVRSKLDGLLAPGSMGAN